MKPLLILTGSIIAVCFILHAVAPKDDTIPRYHVYYLSKKSEDDPMAKRRAELQSKLDNAKLPSEDQVRQLVRARLAEENGVPISYYEYEPMKCSVGWYGNEMVNDERMWTATIIIGRYIHNVRGYNNVITMFR